MLSSPLSTHLWYLDIIFLVPLVYPLGMVIARKEESGDSLTNSYLVFPKSAGSGGHKPGPWLVLPKRGLKAEQPNGLPWVHRARHSLARLYCPMTVHSLSHPRKWDQWIQPMVADTDLWPSLSPSLDLSLQMLVMRFFYFVMLLSLSHANPHWGVSSSLHHACLSIHPSN